MISIETITTVALLWLYAVHNLKQKSINLLKSNIKQKIRKNEYNLDLRMHWEKNTNGLCC